MRQRRGLKAKSTQTPSYFGGIAAFHHDGLDFPRPIAAERRGFFVLWRLEARDALLERIEFYHHEAMEFVGPLHDLEAPAAGEYAAPIFGEDSRDMVGVLLVFDGIDDARTRHPIGGHATSSYSQIAPTGLGSGNASLSRSGPFNKIQNR